MKKIFTGIISIFLLSHASAQSTFPVNGDNVGIGTNAPSSLLTLNSQYAQIKLQGASSGWSGPDIILTRTSSGNSFQRSPNIQFMDLATGSSAYIQAYQGNLQFMPGGVQTFTLATTGFVGVNSTSPLSTFQVSSFGTKLNVGSANNTSLYGTSYLGFNAARQSSGAWRFDGNVIGSSNGDGGAVIYSDIYGNLNFAAVPSLNGAAFFERTDDQLKAYVAFQVTSAGLARAKKLKIETANFPDYVFNSDYKLPSLSSIALYINQNHRLPEMPSADEVHADGMDVGELNKLLVKKVEELTLYLLKKDAELKELKSRMDRFERKGAKKSRAL